VLEAGDDTLRFWGALPEVLPETAEQRCWLDETGRRAVLNSSAICCGRLRLAVTPELADLEEMASLSRTS
jgi:hypothetical protein